MKGKNVGELYLGPDGQVYRMRSYCSMPTAEFENVATGEMVAGAVGSPIFEGFDRLIDAVEPEAAALFESFALRCGALRRARDQFEKKYLACAAELTRVTGVSQ